MDKSSSAYLLQSNLPSIPSAHEHSDIYLQLCKWGDYQVFLITTVLFARLLLDDIYHLIELPFDWLINDTTLSCLLDEFKFQYNNNKKSFRNRYFEHDTEFSKYVWKLKDLGKTFILKWSIDTCTSPYRCGTKRCDLCIKE